jgi:serine/threonine-protein phosphatase 2B catalytic subunit
MGKTRSYLLFILAKEANTVKVAEPIVIVGDLHGQFYDLIHMLEKAGDP